MIRTIGAVVLAAAVALSAAPALAADQPDPYEGIPGVCVPFVETEREIATTSRSYLIGLLEAAERRVWARDDRIQRLRSVVEVRKQKIRKQAREIRRLRGELRASSS